MANLLTVETTKRGSRLDEDNTYRATFDTRPDDDDVRQAQIKHGYHPGGYGGPSRIDRTAPAKDGDPWVVTWRSFASCD